MDIQWNEAAERCWNFELWLYEQPAVARCCLSLKDRFDVDVVLLLLTAWLGTRGYILQQVDVREAMAKTALWRSAIVKRVRRARLESKRLSYSGGFEVSRFRERLKLSELEAERVELSLLADCIRYWSSVQLGTIAPDIVENNLLTYLSEIMPGYDRESLEREISCIIAACETRSELTRDWPEPKGQQRSNHSAGTSCISDDFVTRIEVFLDEHNIMSLATMGLSGVHATNLFYARDKLSLILVSDPKSQHSINIETHKEVAATVAGSDVDFENIRGIQIHGVTQRDSRDKDGSPLFDLLKARYPRLAVSAVSSDPLRTALERTDGYLLKPKKIVFIDNSKGFGHKEFLELEEAK